MYFFPSGEMKYSQNIHPSHFFCILLSFKWLSINLVPYTQVEKVFQNDSHVYISPDACMSEFYLFGDTAGTSRSKES